MRKTIHILFTIVFAVVTSGFTVNKHYSGSELFSFAIFSEPESCCEDVCSCCDEASETFQFLVDYSFSTDNIESAPTETELLAVILALITSGPEVVSFDSSLIDQDLPPPDNLTRLSFNQSFLL